MQINYFTNSEPANRLNPTKCPFCSPSSLMCGWSGHNAAHPSPQAVGASERATKPAPSRVTIYHVRALAAYPGGYRRVAGCVRTPNEVGAALASAFPGAEFSEIHLTELPLYSGPSLT